MRTPGRSALQLSLLFLGTGSRLVLGTNQAASGHQPLYQAVLGNGDKIGECSDDLLVKTSLFTVQGAVSPETADVRQFLGIPFAEAPVGQLRFRPPVTKKATDDLIDATKYGPYCYQHDPVSSVYFSDNLAGFQVLKDQIQSEDCLTLDIWAPRQTCGNGSSEAGHVGQAAVMIWIHGGALMNGDSSAPYTRGTRLVQNHEDIIVVSINYRVNIFGFPRAEALDGHNLNPGFLDVRKAVEWVYQNIHAFGGNPNQMMLFGDSAGSTCVDKYIYAWHHDPLVKSFIMQSGQGEISGDPSDHSNFTFVADKLGCGGNKDEVFHCMQQADADDIIRILNTYDSVANGGRSLNFQPQADNETSFSNYTDLQVRGIYSHLPQIIGNCDNEFASLYQPFTGEAPDQDVLDGLSDGMFICPAAKAARARQDSKIPIWRYRYFGEFPNQNFLPWLHAYHGSDVPMAFGTTDVNGPDTAEQAALSAYMQSVWVEFTKDPHHALIDKFKWPLYSEDEETLIRLGRGNTPEPDFVKGSTYDKSCSSITAPLQYS